MSIHLPLQTPTHVRSLVTVTTQTPTLPVMPRSNKPPMIQRTYRTPAALYEQAMARAAERQEDLSDVIRAALAEYVKPREGESA